MPEEQTVVFQLRDEEAALTFTNPAQLNQMWGDISSQLGEAGVMGDHSSSHGVFTPDPGEGGRTGVGNLSMDNDNFQFPDSDLTDNNMADGGQGLHAIFQASRLGDPNLPEGSAEAEIGPLVPDPNGPVGFELLL